MKDFRTIAQRQHGVVSRAQLIVDCGHDRKQVWRACEGALLEEVLPGIYRVDGSPKTWHQQVMAAVLWAPGAVASHATAAALWDLDGFRQEGIEITTLKRRRTKEQPFTAHLGAVPAALTTTRSAIPVTTIARTLADLGLVLPGDRFGRTVEDALRRGYTTLAALQAFLRREDGRWHHGNGPLRAWLAGGEVEKGPSASRYQREVRDLLAPLGSFREEAPILDEDGRPVATVDSLFDAAPVIVEEDGRKHHSGRDDWLHDLHRRNKVTSLGYFVLHVTPQDLKTPESRTAFVARVVGTLKLCGAVSRNSGQDSRRI